jgi:hypothetical protein
VPSGIGMPHWDKQILKETTEKEQCEFVLPCCERVEIRLQSS